MQLVIVESKSKTKTIEKILGKEFRVLASSGHIDNLPKKELGIDVDAGFKPRYVLASDKKKVVAQLQDQAAKASMVWLATDKDYEGERIAEALRKRLGLTEFRRVYFTEITPAAIQASFENPSTQLNRDYLDCQEARRVMDRLIGYKLSPIIWKHFTANSKTPLSIGRVQAATLALVVRRENEIRDFNPEKKWILSASFSTLEDKATLYCDQHVEDSLSRPQVIELLQKIHEEWSIKISEVEKTRTYPPKPFITSTLQQVAYQQLRYPIKKTMKLAQELYEKGLITYMRTDSAVLSQDFVEKATTFLKTEYGSQYIVAAPRVVKNNKSAQEAHEAIRPTSTKKDITLSEEHQRLYTLIWERAMGFLMSPAEYEQARVRIRDSSFSPTHAFQGIYKSLVFDGFLVLNGKHPIQGPLDIAAVEKKIGAAQQLRCQTIDATQKINAPPARLEEASLVRLMETEGIGRPATYQQSIEKLVDKRYIEKQNYSGQPQSVETISWRGQGQRLAESKQTVLIGAEKNRFGTTELGQKIFEFMNQYFQTLIDIDFTRTMEQKMDDIVAQKNTRLGVLQEFYVTLTPLLSQQFSKTVLPKKEDVAQHKIGRKIYRIREGPYGLYLHYKNDKKTVNLGVQPYLDFMKKSAQEINVKDIKLLISFPKIYDSKKLEYGRYGLFLNKKWLPKLLKWTPRLKKPPKLKKRPPMPRRRPSSRPRLLM